MNTARRPCRTEMLQITCPWCGPREEIEFRHGGQECGDPSTVHGRGVGATCCICRANPAGALAERWVHVHGCGQWFGVVARTR